MKVVIIAGGKGTRMGGLTQTIPKPMIPIAGKPILEHQIELVRRYGLTDVVVLTGYKGNVIEDYFGDGRRCGVDIMYCREDAPLGTAGAVKEIEDFINSDFLVLYGDLIMDMDLDSLVSTHLSRKPMATIVVHPNDHPYDSDIVEVDEEDRVTAFYNKPHKEGVYYRNLVNAAVYAMSPMIMKYIPKGAFSDFARDIFPRVMGSGETICAYNTPEYIKDIGTMERLSEVEADIISGKVGRLNKRNKRKAVFIDRDGVMNPEPDLSRPVDGFELYPGTTEAVKSLNKSEYLSVVVTNQPAVAKGFITMDDLNAVHAKLETLLGQDRAYIDRIYYCPHHPEKGFEGEVSEYKMDCDCRKPRTGLIEKAIKDLNIDIDGSFIIGDRTVDIMTGINAGLKTVLVRTGYAGGDGKYRCEPDFVFENLKDAVDFIIGVRP